MWGLRQEVLHVARQPGAGDGGGVETTGVGAVPLLDSARPTLTVGYVVQYRPPVLIEESDQLHHLGQLLLSAGEVEDPAGFPFGGWQAPLLDEVAGAQVGAAYKGTDALLPGRRTDASFAAYPPY